MSLAAGFLAVDHLTLGQAVLAAAAICAALIVLLRPLLQRYALARPNARSSHVMPTPQGAGIAVIAATLSITSLWVAWIGLAIPSVLFAATAFLALLGLLDDVKPIPVLPRLLLQASAVGAVLLAAPSDLRIASICPLVVERALLFIAGLWFVNLVNFMDGLDLMTVVESVPITGALITMGWFGLYPPLPAVVAAALCGAMLGFAPFNRPVARVFLGDVGSLPIGLLLGWCLLQLAWHGHLIAALLLPLYYIADATLTLLRRMSRGEAFWVAHRSHFYQRATENGFTVIEIVGHVFVVNVALVLMAMASTKVVSASAHVFLLSAGASLVSLVLYRFSLPRKR
jgi:UDP-N-acetylmuramyl pentapeptide phosphotransferase/UDP-N-acetylglucosamine-1-phosphate transferase